MRSRWWEEPGSSQCVIAFAVVSAAAGIAGARLAMWTFPEEFGGPEAGWLLELAGGASAALLGVLFGLRLRRPGWGLEERLRRGARSGLLLGPLVVALATAGSTAAAAAGAVLALGESPLLPLSVALVLAPLAALASLPVSLPVGALLGLVLGALAHRWPAPEATAWHWPPEPSPPDWRFLLRVGTVTAAFGALGAATILLLGWGSEGPPQTTLQVVALALGSGLVGAFIAQRCRAGERRFLRRLFSGAWLGALLGPLVLPTAYGAGWVADNVRDGPLGETIGFMVWGFAAGAGLILGLSAALGAYTGAWAGALAHWWPEKRGEGRS